MWPCRSRFFHAFPTSIWEAEIEALDELPDFAGRGSWIRTNDLQYPKLPRYQAALYPEYLGNHVDTRFKPCQQGWRPAVSPAVEQGMRHAVAGRDPVFLRRARSHLQNPLCRASRRNDLGG